MNATWARLFRLPGVHSCKPHFFWNSLARGKNREGKFTASVFCSIAIIAMCSSCVGVDMETLIVKAQEFQKANLFDKAAVEYLQASKLADGDDSKKADLLLSAGDCMYYNDSDDEMKIYKEVLSLPSATKGQLATARLRIARRHMRDGDYKAAVGEMEILISQGGMSSIQKAEAYASMGEAFRSLKQGDAAAKAIRQALSIKSGLNADSRINLARLLAGIFYYRNGCSTQKTDEQMREALGGDASDSAFLTRIGIINTLTNPKEFARSKAMCDDVIKDPGSDEMLRLYASISQVENLIGLKSYDEAILLADQVLAQHKEGLSTESTFNVEWNKASALLCLKRYDDAIIEFRKIVDMKNVYYSPLAQFQIGRSYSAQGKRDDAIEAFEDLKKMPLLQCQLNMLKDADREILEIKGKSNAPHP